MIVSIALHALVLLVLLTSAVATGLIRVDPHHPLGIPSILSRGVGGREIRERVGWVALPSPAPAARVAPNTPVPPRLVEPPRPATPVEKVAPASPPRADTSRLPPTSPGGPTGGPPRTDLGPGLRTGPGAGAGTGAAVGRGSEQDGTPAAKVRATYVDLPAVGLDPPKRVLPFHLVAMFEINPRGDSRILSLTPTRDGDFNKRIRSELLEIRWRPAVAANGIPVSDTVLVSLDFE